MSSLFEWTRVWVWTVHTQDAGRVWCRYVWRTHIPGIPGMVFSPGLYVYRAYDPEATGSDKMNEYWTDVLLTLAVCAILTATAVLAGAIWIALAP